jgi:ubiquinone/menaquinone biosynthesis C-methylase UbiE
MTELDKKSVRSWDLTYQQRNIESFWTEEAVPHVVDLSKRFPAGEYPLVLDVPCGDGRNLIPWAAKRRAVVGVDSSRTALTNGPRLAGHLGLENILFLEGGIFELPFYDSQFDVVFCWDLLGHLQDAVGAIHELARVTKLGGRIIGSVFAVDDSVRDLAMTRLGPKESLYNDTFFFRFFERSDVTKLTADANLDMSHIELAVWREGPHPGYREYPHEHRSWCFEGQKR